MSTDRITAAKAAYAEAKVTLEAAQEVLHVVKRELAFALAERSGLHIGDVIVTNKLWRFEVTDFKLAYGDRLRPCGVRILKNGARQSHTTEIWQSYKKVDA